MTCCPLDGVNILLPHQLEYSLSNVCMQSWKGCKCTHITHVGVHACRAKDTRAGISLSSFCHTSYKVYSLVHTMYTQSCMHGVLSIMHACMLSWRGWSTSFPRCPLSRTTSQWASSSPAMLKSPSRSFPLLHQLQNTLTCTCMQS